MFILIESVLNNLRSFALLVARLVVAYGFSSPAIAKIKSMDNTINQLVSMKIPMPEVSAYLLAGIELVGILLLMVGLFTRYISIPLLFIMCVAIYLIHFNNGFYAVNNGFEIPLYYAIFCMIFISFGAGKFSFDYLFFQKSI